MAIAALTRTAIRHRKLDASTLIQQSEVRTELYPRRETVVNVYSFSPFRYNRSTSRRPDWRVVFSS